MQAPPLLHCLFIISMSIVCVYREVSECTACVLWCVRLSVCVSTCVCVCVCEYVCLCVCEYVCMCVCVCTCVCVYVSMCVCVYVSMCACTHTCPCVGQRFMSGVLGVFFNPFSLFFLNTGTLPEPGTHILAKLAASQHWDDRLTPPLPPLLPPLPPLPPRPPCQQLWKRRAPRLPGLQWEPGSHLYALSSTSCADSGTRS